MSATIERGQAVRRELRSIDKSTKILFRNKQIDHREEFRKTLRERQGVFVSKLAGVLELHRLCRQMLDEWKTAVFRGEETYSEGAEEALKDLFLVWNGLAAHFKQRVEFYGRHGLPLHPHMADLNSFIGETTRILQDWEKPGLSQAISLRTRKLSKAGEGKLKKLTAKKAM